MTTTLPPSDPNYQSTVKATAWTRLTWDSAHDQNGITDLVNERTAKLEEMTAAGKCDSRGWMITPVITVRPWLNEAAAQEFVTFIQALATKYNAKLVSAEILFSPPPRS
jgi:hypothetical protein